MSLRPNARTEVRRNRYKVAVDADEGRRRREDNMVEIRKNKREESLQKKRREGLQDTQQFSIPAQTASGLEKKLENLPDMVAGVWTDDSSMQLEATTQFRKLLSIERSPPIEEVIQSGVVPRFIEFLMREDYPQLQFEAAWALTNIASGTSEHTKVVIDHGAVPIFAKLLGSPSDDVREQAVWALGNVAGDSPKCRDLVLGHGALVPLLAQLNEHAKLSMLRNATWTLSNFCRGKPQPAFDQTRPALPALQRLIHSNDEEVLTDACWALSYLSDGTNDKIQAVIESGVCPRLVELLLHPSPSVLIPALRTIGNIVTGDDMQTQFIINYQALPCLLNLLTNNHKKSIKKEACWTISNITAGNKEQIQSVIEANIIGPLVQLLQNAEFDIKKEAAWALSNATSGGTHEQIKYLVSQACIKPLCDLLVCPDARIVTVCLEGLENILKVGEAEKNLGLSGEVNLYAQMIDDAEGLEKIENLQSHDNNEIYEKAVKILETYWLEEDDETLPPGDASQQQGFHFGKNLSFKLPNPIIDFLQLNNTDYRHYKQNMSSTVNRTPKSGRQSLFYQDLASPISTLRSGSKFSTPGQAAAVSALWRENFANSDLPPPPVFTLEDRSDFSPESGIPDYPISPEVKSDPRTPFQGSGKEFSTPKSKSKASTSYALMGGQLQNRQSPVGSLSWWSPAKSGTGGSGDHDDKGKGSGSPVEGVVQPGALVTLPPPREVARPEMQRNSVLVGPLDEEEWVTVYGFSPVDTNLVLREFENCGVILKHVPGPRDANWMNILYQNRADAQKALAKNGMQINGVLIIGVKPVDPIQRQTLNERLNNQGFFPLPPPSTKISELNSLRSSSRPYYVQSGTNTARQSSGIIATPAKSLASKVMDVMFGF